MKEESHSEELKWNGDDLPPVGIFCEYKTTFFSTREELNSGICKVIAFYDGKVWIDINVSSDFVINLDVIRFLPLKTEAEKERDELIELALSLDCDPYEGMLSRRGFVGAMLDAGWRPQEAKK